MCLCEEKLPNESNGLGVQGWPAHSAPDATKRRVAVTHRHFSPHRASLLNESQFRADHTEVLSARNSKRCHATLSHQIDFDAGLTLCFWRTLYNSNITVCVLWVCVRWHNVFFCVSVPVSCGDLIYFFVFLRWCRFLTYSISDAEGRCCSRLLVGGHVCLSAELPAKHTVYSERRRFGWNLWLACVGVWMLCIKLYG